MPRVDNGWLPQIYPANGSTLSARLRNENGVAQMTLSVVVRRETTRETGTIFAHDFSLSEGW
jgi:hypothetical protein